MEPEEVAELFASRLRELRTQKGWTQQELAEQAGLAKSGIANLEQGRTQPSWDTVIRLSAALKVGCDAFQQQPGESAAPGRGRPGKPASQPTARMPNRKRKSG